ncbi:hypothetical protein SAY87_021361 [Trapa incisa]|uniref:Uncharacterized protein n=1 Tax=Trapa incisa TaxID=236973 RepID=A0AAN7JRZ8_9MYRT|nr:hypothetical protein SAY87_021361 [Trapa incisa]
MTAAIFVLVMEILESWAYLENSSSLVLYLSEHMHMSPSTAANNLTNFMGTAFLLALLGSFFSDVFFTTYRIYLISATMEFLGLVVLTLQAKSASLKPPPCNGDASYCEEVHGGKAVMLFAGIYLVAIGVGGIKGFLLTHGAEQFDESTVRGRMQRSTFFNYFVFCLSCGGLIAETLVIWVEDNKGWQWYFGMSTLAILLSASVFLAGSGTYRNRIPSGSPLTTMLKVLVASGVNSFRLRSSNRSSNNSTADMVTSPSNMTTIPKDVTHLERAVVQPRRAWLECSVEQVEDVKSVIRILPIFACAVILNCCLAQLSTFSVQQAATMDTKLMSLNVPPASFPIFPILLFTILAPVYDHVILPFARRATKSVMGITHLQRIGMGLVLSIVAIAVAAMVEIKRKRVAAASSMTGSGEPLPITFFWVTLQYLFLGSADHFTLVGLHEFFFSEAPT